MYTNSGARGAAHEWIDTITSVGEPSYIAVQAFRSSHSTTYTSALCSALGSATFLLIPRTHVLLSLAASAAAFRITSLSDDAAYPFQQHVTLDPTTHKTFNDLKGKLGDVAIAVRGARGKVSAQNRAQNPEAGDGYKSESIE